MADANAKRAHPAPAVAEYTRDQKWMGGAWVFDLWDEPPFAYLFDGEARYYMPRLLHGVCISFIAQRPLTMQGAFVAMNASHGQTVGKYTQIAEDEGYLEKQKDPDDGRMVVLIPTRRLLQIFDAEITRVLDDMRNLLGAMAAREGSCRLPDTGAADVKFQGKIDNSNRHLQRADDKLSPRTRAKKAPAPVRRSSSPLSFLRTKS
jgi:DNA-binding MarR family transcriptional regulator